MRFVLNLIENSEFDISAPSLEDRLRHIDECLSILEKEQQSKEGQESPSTFSEDDAVKLGCTIFDIKATIDLIQNEPERSSSYLRSLNSHLKKIQTFLKEQKIEVIDHTNEIFYPTLKVDVLEFEEDSEVDKPTISETIEPSIYFQDKLVKRGKVIVKKN